MQYPILTGLIRELLAIANNAAVKQLGKEALGKAIEQKIEQAEREPDDAKRSAIHEEALGMEKELAKPETEPAKTEPTKLEAITTTNWQDVICSVGTAKTCFGIRMGDLCGHSVKLEKGRRNCDFLAKWFAAKPPVTEDDKRTFEAYEYAEAFTQTREHGSTPKSASTTVEGSKAADAAELDLGETGEPAKEEAKTFDWKTALCPWEIKFTNLPLIEKGTKLGDIEPKMIKGIHKVVIPNTKKFPIKTISEKQFAAAVEMAVEELKLAA